MEDNCDYKRGFLPYALGALLIGLVGGFSTVLGPAFVQDMGIAYQNTTWTALAQAMSTAACAPILGKLGDVVGRKFTLLLGIAVFTLGNLLSAVANALAFMLVARFVVGIGAAAMTPVIMAYIVAEFPQDQVASGFAKYMLISSGAVIVGPTLGGFLVSRYGWRAMVWVCVAICLVLFLACGLLTGKPAPQRKSMGHFDSPGAVFVILFFSLLLCVPSFGQNFGWSSGAFFGVLAGAGVSLVGLLVVESKAAQPILPGSFLKRSPFFLSILGLFLTQGLMQANMTNTIVLVSETGLGSSAVSGYVISVMYLGMSLGAVLLGPLADRIEPKYVLTGSLLVTALGCGLMFLPKNTSVPLLMIALGLLGFGLGGNGTIFMKAALSGLSPREAGVGTGIYGLFRDLAAPFGVAVFVPMFTNQLARFAETGASRGQAALRAMQSVGLVELGCIGAGIVVVWFLPKIHPGGDKKGADQSR